MSKPLGTRNKRMPDWKIVGFKERDPNKLVQSWSAFTEEMYLGIPSSLGGGFQSVRRGRELTEAKRHNESEEYLGLQIDSSSQEASHFLIFQSSINPKK